MKVIWWLGIKEHYLAISWNFPWDLHLKKTAAIKKKERVTRRLSFFRSQGSKIPWQVSSVLHERSNDFFSVTSLVSQKLSHPWLRGSQRPDNKTLSTFLSLSFNWCSGKVLLSKGLAFTSWNIKDWDSISLLKRPGTEKKRERTLMLKEPFLRAITYST